MIESLSAASGIILPVFGIIGFGLAAARFGLLGHEVGEALSDFVYFIAIPILLFRTMATLETPEVSPWPYWLSFFGSVAVVWIVAALIARRVFGRDHRAAVIAGVSSGFSNIGLVGLPFALIAFGDAGGVPILLLLSVQMPIMMTAGTLLVERAERLDGTVDAPFSATAVVRRIATNLARNPIVIGIMCGLAWRLSGAPMTGVPEAITGMFAAAAVPCALFALGMGLTRYRLGGTLAPAIIVAILKLMVLPALVWLATTRLADLPQVWVMVAVMAAACPTGINAWLIASRFNTGLALSANAIAITTAASLFTMGLWLVLLGA